MSAIATHPDYMKLVRIFPARPIHDEADYESATRILTRLLGRTAGDLTPGEQDYADALAVFIERYDAANSTFTPTDMKPLDALKHLMRTSGISANDLAKSIGVTHATVSMILHGKRGISKEVARELAGHFRVNVGLFID